MCLHLCACLNSYVNDRNTNISTAFPVIINTIRVFDSRLFLKEQSVMIFLKEASYISPYSYFTLLSRIV